MSNLEPLIIGRMLDFERSEERFVVVSIALLVPCFALVGLISTLSAEGPRSLPRLAIALAIFVTTIPVGIAMRRLAPGRTWWRTSPSFWRAEVGFIVYADLGVAGVLFTFVDHETAMYGTALFAVTGNYASHFVTMRVVAGHVGFAAVVIAALSVLTWHQGEHDAAGVIARCMTSLIVVSAAMMVYVFTSGLRRILNRQFDEAARDPLTGLLNRRSFATLIADILVREHVVSFIVLDVDQFKTVNDRFGHAAGDQVLELLGERLRRFAGTATFVARTGGEEFALAIRQGGGNPAALAEQVRSVVGDAADEIPVTVSVGVSRFVLGGPLPCPTDTAQLLLEALHDADSAMYEAKATGGNRVVTRLRG